MKLYSRDYFTITPEEEALWEEVKKQETEGVIEGFRRPLYHLYPKAVRHYDSLFPNNYLCIYDLKDKECKYSKILEEFKAILDSKTTTERTILNFIKEKTAYFIIGSILRRNYNFGHHSAYLFPEFKLPPNYNVDYLIVGRSTGGFQFVFVELENIYKSITLNDGSFGKTIRKGITQIEEWDLWLEQNYSHLIRVFEQNSNKKDNIPHEFRDLDKTRINYCVVSGRRDYFKEKTYRLRRKYKEERKILILHYDNLFDSGLAVLDDGNY